MDDILEHNSDGESKCSSDKIKSIAQRYADGQDLFIQSASIKTAISASPWASNAVPEGQRAQSRPRKRRAIEVANTVSDGHRQKYRSRGPKRTVACGSDSSKFVNPQIEGGPQANSLNLSDHQGVRKVDFEAMSMPSQSQVDAVFFGRRVQPDKTVATDIQPGVVQRPDARNALSAANVKPSANHQGNSFMLLASTVSASTVRAETASATVRAMSPLAVFEFGASTGESMALAVIGTHAASQNSPSHKTKHVQTSLDDQAGLVLDTRASLNSSPIHDNAQHHVPTTTLEARDHIIVGASTVIGHDARSVAEAKVGESHPQTPADVSSSEVNPQNKLHARLLTSKALPGLAAEMPASVGLLVSPAANSTLQPVRFDTQAELSNARQDLQEALRPVSVDPVHHSAFTTGRLTHQQHDFAERGNDSSNFNAVSGASRSSDGSLDRSGNFQAGSPLTFTPVQDDAILVNPLGQSLDFVEQYLTNTTWNSELEAAKLMIG